MNEPPWRAEHNFHSGSGILDADDNVIAAVTADDCRAIAERIVTAVNCHAELVAALREMRTHLESHARYGLNEEEIAMLKRADAVLQKAEAPCA